VRFADELRQGRGQRSAEGRIDVAVGAQDEQVAVAEPAGEELQEQQRRLVGSVKIIERHDERASLRGAADERRNGLEEAKARPLPLQCRWLGELREASAQLGQELGDVRCAAAELRSEPFGVGVAEVRAEGLDPGPVGRRAAGLPAPADEHCRPAGPCVLDQRLGEPALADPRLAGEEDQTPAPGDGVVQSAGEHSHLSAPADESPARGVRSRFSRRWALADDQLQAGVLGEDRPLELAKPLPGLDPELLDERPACVLIRLERVRLPVAAVEREHELAAQALSVRVLADQDLELLHDLRVPRERQLRLDQVLQCRDMQVLETSDLGQSERLVGEVRQR
jgi:hypothetical protein